MQGRRFLAVVLAFAAVCMTLPRVGAAEAAYAAVPLDYTRDVFALSGETLSGEMLGQGSGLTIAMREDTFVSLPGYDAQSGVLTAGGVPYQMGPLATSGTPSAAPNAVKATDTNPITVDLQGRYCAGLYLLANSVGTDGTPAPATVTVHYLDGTTAVAPEVSRILSFRMTDTPSYLPGEAQAAKPGAFREGGTYSGGMFTYAIAADPQRPLDSLTIDCATAVLFAVTAAEADMETLRAGIQQQLAALPDAAQLSLADRPALSLLTQRIEEWTARGGVAETLAGYQKWQPALARMAELEADSSALELHVSPRGSDANNGTAERPLASLDGARRALRRQPKDRPIRVVFAAGTYPIADTVHFDRLDAGTEQFPVTYAAQEGGEVVFTGAAALDTSAFGPVTDAAMAARFPEAARSHIRVLDLDTQSVGPFAALQLDGAKEAVGGEAPLLFYNGARQDIAQWPNGENGYTTWDEVITPGDVVSGKDKGAGGTFRYRESQPGMWGDVSEAYFAGYPGYDYRYERIPLQSVDREERTITLACGSDFGLTSAESGRWKVFNVPEELDVPGEWYLDRAANCLYFYPPGPLNGATVELATCGSDMVDAAGVSFVSFSGLAFEKTRAGGMTLRNGVHDVTVDGCTFRHIGGRGVTVTGNNRSVLDSGIANGGTRCAVTDCEFAYIGSSAVWMAGGDRDTLEAGGNVICGNTIYSPSCIVRNQPAVVVSGVGIAVQHNAIHNAPFHAINFEGVDHVIRYNELYNVCREVYDAGVVYSGRSLIRRGTEIAYNYIHDYARKDARIGYDTLGVFLDDRMSGIDVHHNVFARGGAAVQVGGGQDNTVTANTMVDMQSGMIHTDNRGETWPMFQDGALEKRLQEALGNEAYAGRFPELAQTAADPLPPWRNTIAGNLTDAALSIHTRVAELGTVTDNAVTLDETCFVDPAAHDYRVRQDAPQLEQTPDVLSESFDLSQIGPQHGKQPTSGAFAKRYPLDGAAGSAVACAFGWDDAQGADGYRLTIATDAGMRDVVRQQWSDYTDTTVRGLSAGTYYWQVTAVNSSLAAGREWPCSGQPYRVEIGEQAVFAPGPVSVAADLSGLYNAVYLAQPGEALLDARADQYGSYQASAPNRQALSDAAPDGYLDVGGVRFTLPQLSEQKTCISSGQSLGEFCITLPQGRYERICLLAAADGLREGYPVRVAYSDGTSQAHTLNVGRYYSAYWKEGSPAFRFAVELPLVNYQTGQPTGEVGGVYCLEVPCDPVKQVTGLWCAGRGGTPVQIYAVTGIRPEIYVTDAQIEVCAMLDNPAQHDIPARVYAALCGPDGELLAVRVQDAVLAAGARGAVVGAAVPYDGPIPDGATAQCYIWSSDGQQPVTAGRRAWPRWEWKGKRGMQIE